MTSPDQRKAFTDGLRALAEFLDANEQIPLPYGELGIWAYPEYDGNGYEPSNIAVPAEVVARDIRRGTSGWTKQPHTSADGHVTYTKTFTPDGAERAVRYNLYAAKTGTCERVQVGTRHVEATEAHDEPIYEWRCGS